MLSAVNACSGLAKELDLSDSNGYVRYQFDDFL